ncbi:TIGR03619 family F420-dependent LLM class oxidoreductase [Mycobacterium sp. 236(2023)]|uniref:TIGR03619 family F420-dependent LLM class oxidoreductase n=1 Tax=Mycobacterium sp. 236(2023) TaxID=3038163 RepID=UPI0024156ED5|nr:TIGR03619 family F420-dependent LLM class oxidoreductase [Mycobacterium sp. 236(2023)]MDG4668053.1 TIGR03619 family F420-dependent LLM class oxidoreductase [Mycobacterium sp. 236(2023)]
MKFWLSHILAPADQLIPLAQHADQLGFEGVMGPDHLVWWGNQIRSKYPYNETGQVWWPQESHWPDPWTATAAMAAATTRVRFGHHVFILPLRDPVSVAKSIATISAMVRGRVVLAFGIGWMREEFELVGQPFRDRGRRTDEMLDIMELLWTGEGVGYEGEFYRFHGVSLRPTPAERVPIIGAGHSEPALRRAGRRCDGWLGASRFDRAELKVVLDKLGEYRSDAGRANHPFEILVSLRKRDHSSESVDEVQAMGVTGLMVSPWTIVATDEPDSLAGKLKAMDVFAEQFLR